MKEPGVIGKMGCHVPSYESIRKFVYVLEELGLIEFVREEEAKRRGGSTAEKILHCQEGYGG